MGGASVRAGSSSPILRQMLEQDHRQLRTEIRRTRRALSALVARVHDPQEGCSPVEVADALEGLLVKIRLHFARELRGGYLSDALTAAPRFSRRGARLLAEHTSLADEIGSIVDRARGAGQSAEAWSDIERDFLKFIALLQHHEVAEDNLLRDAMMEDVGTMD